MCWWKRKDWKSIRLQSTLGPYDPSDLQQGKQFQNDCEHLENPTETVSVAVGLSCAFLLCGVRFHRRATRQLEYSVVGFLIDVRHLLMQDFPLEFWRPTSTGFHSCRCATEGPRSSRMGEEHLINVDVEVRPR